MACTHSLWAGLSEMLHHRQLVRASLPECVANAPVVGSPPETYVLSEPNFSHSGRARNFGPCSFTCSAGVVHTASSPR